ncbi:MAG: GNAT family N-acetyltransferase [Beijerinckiaceae bacterium]
MKFNRHAGFADLDALWRSFEQTGAVTPYQRLGWTRAWSETVAPAIGMQPMLLTLTDNQNKPLAIMPIGQQIQRGVKVIRFLGGKHANYNMPVFAAGGMEKISADALHKALMVFGAAEGIDLFVFDNQPVSWKGEVNPFAGLKAIPSPSSAWKRTLMADGEEMARGLMSSESRKKLRHKEKKLGEFGTVTYSAAKDSEQAAAFLSAFLAQKAARFATLGIDNPFTEAGVEAFLQKVVRLEPDRKPDIHLFAMLTGERILAVFGGAIHDGRYTGMFTSFDTDQAVSRYSPGDLLLLNLMKHLCSEGIQTFDLGTGEAAYKSDYCDTEEPLVDCLLPVTAKGRLAVQALSVKQKLKRWIKQNDQAMALIKRMRRLRSA